MSRTFTLSSGSPDIYNMTGLSNTLQKMTMNVKRFSIFYSIYQTSLYWNCSRKTWFDASSLNLASLTQKSSGESNAMMTPSALVDVQKKCATYKEYILHSIWGTWSENNWESYLVNIRPYFWNIYLNYYFLITKVIIIHVHCRKVENQEENRSHLKSHQSFSHTFFIKLYSTYNLL